MKPFLMGAETEYAVSGRKGAVPLATRDVHSLLFKAIQKERRWLSDVIGGEALYLENGGRFYLDYGLHPEYATPECMTPEQVAAYDKAGEALLELARQRVCREDPSVHITLLKNNLNPLFPDDVTWGTHESYTCWAKPVEAARAMLPFLVSRTLFAGSGCLSASPAGNGFELSQRARHVGRPVGSETTGDRALFCTRVRKVSDASARQGWMRAHLISKDSQRSPFGIYLTHGTTGLIFVLLNEGRPLGQGLELKDTLRALRTVSCDPWLRSLLPLADGREMTALDLQECYQAECERYVQGGDLPAWAGEVVRHWGETLAGLRRDPLRLARKLDAYYKLFVLDHELSRAGMSWGELRQALETLTRLRLEYTAGVVEAVLADDGKAVEPDERADFGAARETAGVGHAGQLGRL